MISEIQKSQSNKTGSLADFSPPDPDSFSFSVPDDVVLSLLSCERMLPLEPLERSPTCWSQRLGAELDLDYFEGAGELKRHLCIVLVDHWRAGVHANVEAFIESE